MADLNYEQFMVESPNSAINKMKATLNTTVAHLEKVDHKEAYIEYIFECWDD